MRYFPPLLASLAFLLLFSSTTLPQQSGMDMSKPSGERPPMILPGIGSLHHTVTTTSAEAQRFFDQGLSLIYGFNHEEAVRSFKRAAEIDPQMAMAYWGIGYALGPNINLDVDPAREKAAYEATQKALALAGKASESERAYI